MSYHSEPLATLIAFYVTQYSPFSPSHNWQNQLQQLAQDIADSKGQFWTLNIEPKVYYVYVYMDTRKPGLWKYTLPSGRVVSFPYLPFYVGKGTGKRSEFHINPKSLRSNTTKNNIIRAVRRANLEVLIRHSKDSLCTNFLAQAYEIDLIAGIGRRDLRKGPLANLTDGGDGGTGYRMSKKQKEAVRQRRLIEWSRMSEEEYATRCEAIIKGRALGKIPILSESSRLSRSEKAKARRHTTETKARMSATAKARPELYARNLHSPEARAKTGAALKGRPSPIKGCTRTQEFKDSIRAFQTGQTRSKETRKRMSESKKNQADVICPHCGKVGHPSGMKSWHFDNCKLKES